MTQNNLAAASQRAYCRRHGYRMVVQKHWRRKTRQPLHPNAVRTQNLLACTLSKGEKYVLVLDADVMITPWAPPIHHQPLGTKIGIVDEDQPTARYNAAIQQLRSGRIKDESRYYSRPFGDNFKLSHGLLNTGMVIVQPKLHCQWLQDIYYHPASQKWFNDRRLYYDQSVLGAAMVREQNYLRMDHAWNRGWVWYRDAVKVGGLRYTLGQVFRQSYFMHFYLDKARIYELGKLMKRMNTTFRPQPYARNVLP